MPITQIKAALNPHLNQATQIVVAFSGGLDSTVLLHCVSQLSETLSQPIVAIHVNHHLSVNADHWQSHCEAVCQQLNIAFMAKSVHITSNDKGLEAQARTLRYAAIAQSIKPGAVVLTGQHQQDQVETFLLQLKRGAGPKGLSAMGQSTAFADDAVLLRPLLNCSLQTLKQYAKTHQLSWIEDESNLDTRFDRNFLRHEVLPLLNQRWPGFDKAACRSVGLIAELQQSVDEMAAEDLAQAQLAGTVVSGNVLAIATIISLSNSRQRNLLRYWITLLGIELPSQAVLNAMISEVIAAKQDANPKVQWGGHQLRRFDGKLYLFDNSIEHGGEACLLMLEQTVTFEHNIGVLRLTAVVARVADDQSDVLYLRKPSANEQVSVSFDVTGVSCKPLGSPHTRKLKQLFKQYKVPPWARQRTPLIYYNDVLAGVAGLFVCEGFGGEREQDWVFVIFED
ncbi:MAG: tRNA(Ile)-lysidine synthase [Phenylobacterium sp.]|jgi:tRNA(Ile)-lysidine synthase